MVFPLPASRPGPMLGPRPKQLARLRVVRWCLEGLRLGVGQSSYI